MYCNPTLSVEKSRGLWYGKMYVYACFLVCCTNQKGLADMLEKAVASDLFLAEAESTIYYIYL